MSDQIKNKIDDFIEKSVERRKCFINEKPGK